MNGVVRGAVALVVVFGIAFISFTAGFLANGVLYRPVSASPLAGFGAGPLPVSMDHQEAPDDFDVFWEAWTFLNINFYGDFPTDENRVHGAIRGMVASFDDQHTAFIDPTRAAIMSENMTGSFEGIGATIRLDDAGRLTIVDPMLDRPAFMAGLRPGDIILEVDGESVENLSLFESVLLIRGPANSEVVLTIIREENPEPFDVTVVRARIELEVVESEMLADHDDIGYVRLTQFSKGVSGLVGGAIAELRGQGAEKIIFDLRSNPGGLLSEAVAVSNLFVEEGPVVIERLKNAEEKTFDAEPSQFILGDTPLVILVNQGSASASEIVAGAVQDYNMGTVIGMQTFGKGSVQLPHQLSDGSELRVTIAEWLTPLEQQIHGQGITPDIVVEMSFEDFEAGHDPQIDAAAAFLNGETVN